MLLQSSHVKFALLALSFLLAGCATCPPPPSPAEPPAGPGHSQPAGAHAGGHGQPAGAHAGGHGQPAPPGHAQPQHAGGPEPLGRRFDDVAPYVERFERPERASTQRPEEVVAALAVSPGMTVVDLGTGTGYFLPYLARAVGPSGRVLALDISAGMIRHVVERARREGLANVEPRLVLVEEPLLPKATVDRILIVNTWHHIPSRQAYATKLAAALKPAGRLMIVDFTLESAQGPPRAERLAPEAVLAELQAAGMTGAKQIAEQLPDQYIVVASAAPP